MKTPKTLILSMQLLKWTCYQWPRRHVKNRPRRITPHLSKCVDTWMEYATEKTLMGNSLWLNSKQYVPDCRTLHVYNTSSVRSFSRLWYSINATKANTKTSRIDGDLGDPDAFCGHVSAEAIQRHSEFTWTHAAPVYTWPTVAQLFSSDTQIIISVY